MKRYLLPLLLLLSLGMNIGLLHGRLPSAKKKLALPTAERPMPPRLQRMINRMAGDLSLDGSERERFLAIQYQFFRRSIEQRERARQAQRALRNELLKNDPDRDRANALLDATTQAQSAIEKEFVANYFATRELLTRPEQLRLFRRFMAKVRRLRQDMERREERRFDNRAERRRQQAGEQRTSPPAARSPSPPPESPPEPPPPE